MKTKIDRYLVIFCGANVTHILGTYPATSEGLAAAYAHRDNGGGSRYVFTQTVFRTCKEGN